MTSSSANPFTQSKSNQPSDLELLASQAATIDGRQSDAPVPSQASSPSGGPSPDLPPLRPVAAQSSNVPDTTTSSLTKELRDYLNGAKEMERTTFALRMGHIDTLIAHCDRAESRFHTELAAVHGHATQATLAYTQHHKKDATTIGALQKQVELGLEDKVGWDSDRRELDAKVERLEKDRDAQRDAVETAARLRLERRREEDDIDRSLLDALNASSRSSSTDQPHIDNAPKPAGSLPDLPPLPPAPHHVSSDSDMDLESAPSRPLSPRVGTISSASRGASSARMSGGSSALLEFSPIRAPPVKRAASDAPPASSPSTRGYSGGTAENVKKRRTDGLVFAASNGPGGKPV